VIKKVIKSFIQPAPGLCNRLFFKGWASLHNWAGVPSNADKTSEYETPVENEHEEPGNETDARVNQGFYNGVATNANKSEDISSEGQ
jgi:hypothetical protein